MKLSTILAGVTTAVGFASAAPVLEARSGTCTNPAVRKEWRNMGVLEKANYLLSVQCLMIKPSKLKSQFPNAKTRWDDFISLHKDVTPQVHFVPQFLTWHRAFLHVFETALREECFYKYRLPYWNMDLDHDNWLASPVLDSILGFGSNGEEIGGDPNFPGSTGGGCISSGLFKYTRVNIPYSDATTPLRAPRCVKRAFLGINNDLWLTEQAVQNTIANSATYEEFEAALEGDINFADLSAKLGLHNAGHSSVGGDMSDMFISTGDPLFYLHHANVDRIYWLWQQQQSSRHYEVNGALAPRPNPMLIWPNPPSGDFTLAYEMLGLMVPGTNTPIQAGMVTNTKGKGVSPPSGGANGLLCYQYA
ncbi:Di-copper centre-containing protein [Ascodesmis nigricans]|uniref:Di-copper centre-containing protein n=1 Tax=Ascodesmis nigricans TaxID=341454 RepID=A0A4S2MM39_9PEZI|nr:Di-copper centre-containing protein [Ascodesmis nigricans]